MAKRAHGEGTIGQRADGKWYAALTNGVDHNGKPKRRWVYGDTQAEVKKKLRALQRAQEDNTLVDPSKMTLQDFLQTWLKEISPRIKPSTLQKYRQLVDYHLTPRIGKHQLQKFTPLHAQAMQRDIMEQVSPATAMNCHTCLKTALRQAVKWGLVGRNIMEAVDPVRYRKKDISVWEPHHIQQFLQAASEHRLYPVFYTLLTTGLRRGEILGLQWSDLQDGRLTVRRTLVVVANKATFSSPKTEAGERRIPLPADTLQVLEQHKHRQALEKDLAGSSWEEGHLIFPTSVGTPIHPRNLEREWYKLIERAEVPRIRLHDLRHTYATLAISQGVDPKALAQRLGHAKASFTLDVYAHTFEAQREAAALSLADLTQVRVTH